VRKLNESDNKTNPAIEINYATIIAVFLPYLFSTIPINKVFIKPEVTKVN